MQLVTQEVLELFTAAEMARQGCWPLSGGWLNQTRACLDGVRLVWALENELTQPRK